MESYKKGEGKVIKRFPEASQPNVIKVWTMTGC